MSKKEAIAMGRRDFFRKASLGAGAAGIAIDNLGVLRVIDIKLRQGQQPTGRLTTPR